MIETDTKETSEDGEEKEKAKEEKQSASKIAIYMACSMAWFLQYREHVLVPRNVRLVFGKAIHYMLEKFYDVNFKSPESFSNYWWYYWRSNISGELFYIR